MTNPDYTRISLIVDRSGSMDSIREDMDGAIKTYLEEQAKFPGKLEVDVTVFDSIVDTLYSGVKPNKVKFPLIVPRGLTALHDAIGITATKLGTELAALPEKERPGTVLVVVVTDGGENASQEYKGAIAPIIKKQESEFNWKFIFLGANQDAVATAADLGIAKGSAITYNASAAGVSSVSASLSSYSTATRSGLGYNFSDEEREDALASV